MKISDQFSDTNLENLDLETYIKRIRNQKQQNATINVECKVRIYCVYIHIYKNHSVWNKVC